jgi:hypothetical protein
VARPWLIWSASVMRWFYATKKFDNVAMFRCWIEGETLFYEFSDSGTRTIIYIPYITAQLHRQSRVSGNMAMKLPLHNNRLWTTALPENVLEKCTASMIGQHIIYSISACHLSLISLQMMTMMWGASCKLLAGPQERHKSEPWERHGM